MQIDEITETQLGLMLEIIANIPRFSVATIPKDHPHYEVKAHHYAAVVSDIEYLASLGFVKELDGEGKHTVIQALVEEKTGYKYRSYVVTELGIAMFSGLFNDMVKEQEYKNSIN